MDINTVFTYIQFITSKNQGGYVSPDLFNSFWAKAEISHFNDLYGRFQEMRSGSSLPKSGYGQGQIINESLAVFINPMVSVSVASTGISANLPLDIFHIDSMFSPYAGSLVEVRRVQSDHLANELQSKIAPPTIKYPIYVQYNDYIAVYPTSVNSINLTYLRRPVPGVWGYTITGSGSTSRPVYSASASRNSEFDDTQIGDVISKFLEYFGMSTSNQELSQFSMRKDKQGD